MTTEQYIKEQANKLANAEIRIVAVYLNPESWQLLADKLEPRGCRPIASASGPCIQMATSAGMIDILPVAKIARPSFVLE